MITNKKWDSGESYDFIIIGSGMGGSSVAYALKDSGASVLMLERGEFVKQERENWDLIEIAGKRRYAANETWYDSRSKPFNPRIFYNVGGNSKFFGGSSFRLRREDFTKTWPLSYEEMAPWYKKAETLLGVRGTEGEDPTAPEGTGYSLPPVQHEPVIKELAEKLIKQGLHPFHLPLAIDSGPGGRCRKGSPCDGFPCMVRAKGDAENRLLRPLILNSDSNLTLLTSARVKKLIPSSEGKHIEGVSFEYEGQLYFQKARRIILCAGAVNSAVLLLASATETYPRGLANSSEMVGRNYMAHNNSVMMALSPFHKNPTLFQKTLAINDFYLKGWGNIQLRGKIKKEMLQSSKNPFYRLFAGSIAQRSVDLWIMTEDLPRPENRVILNSDGSIQLKYKGNNRKNHRRLIQAASRMMRKAGYPIRLTESRKVNAVQHQCGTVRMGNSPLSAVLDSWCRSYDHPNLFVVDAGFFPSSGAVNPALTIAAMGLRVGAYLAEEFSDRGIS